MLGDSLTEQSGASEPHCVNSMGSIANAIANNGTVHYEKGEKNMTFSVKIKINFH